MGNPDRYEIVVNGGMRQLVLYVDAVEVGDGEWEAERVAMPIGEFRYGDIVHALIRGRYSESAMEAIINNKLLGGEGYEAEWEAMQAWRGECKALAKTIVEEIGGKGDE